MDRFFTRHPFREMANLQRQMERLFQTAPGWESYPRRVGVYPLVNISEDTDHVYVRAELPGVRPEDLEITIENQGLILRGERRIATEEKKVNYHRRERESGFFRRVLRLPAPVSPHNAQAACKDGVLTITMAKPEEVKPRQITVKSA
jgi:HSP20 family protein